MDKTVLKLKPKDREFLLNFTKNGNRNAREFERAYILLALDKGRSHEEISEFYNVSRITIWRVKCKYLDQGVHEALIDESRPGQPIKCTEKDKTEIIAMACSKAPEGRARWTLRLLEKTLKEQKIVVTINRETIRLLLKKTNVNLG
jgi:putative transposase